MIPSNQTLEAIAQEYIIELQLHKKAQRKEKIDLIQEIKEAVKAGVRAGVKLQKEQDTRQMFINNMPSRLI